MLSPAFPINELPAISKPLFRARTFISSTCAALPVARHNATA